MKCSKCQFEQMPNNINILVLHAQFELTEGNFKDIPKVTWEDGHFVLVDSIEEGQREFQIVINDPRAKEEDPVEKERLADIIEKERLEALMYTLKEEQEKAELVEKAKDYPSK
jgi:hypothetical protein